MISRNHLQNRKEEDNWSCGGPLWRSTECAEPYTTYLDPENVAHARQTTRSVATALTIVALVQHSRSLTRRFLGDLATPTTAVCTALAAASPADVALAAADVVVTSLPEDISSEVHPSPPSPPPPNISKAAMTRFSSVVATESRTLDEAGCSRDTYVWCDLFEEGRSPVIVRLIGGSPVRSIWRTSFHKLERSSIPT